MDTLIYPLPAEWSQAEAEDFFFSCLPSLQKVFHSGFGLVFMHGCWNFYAWQ